MVLQLDELKATKLCYDMLWRQWLWHYRKQGYRQVSNIRRTLVGN